MFDQSSESAQLDKLDKENKKLQQEVDGLKEVIRFWSYCTWNGMLRHCPDKQNELVQTWKAYEFKIPPYTN